jgi:hypothetical protein
MSKTVVMDIEKIFIDTEKLIIETTEDFCKALKNKLELDIDTDRIVNIIIGKYNYLIYQIGTRKFTYSHVLDSFVSLFGYGGLLTGKNINSEVVENLTKLAWDLEEVINYHIEDSINKKLGMKILDKLKELDNIEEVVVLTTGYEESQRFKIAILEQQLDFKFDDVFVANKKSKDVMEILTNEIDNDIVYLDNGEIESQKIELGVATIGFNDIISNRDKEHFGKLSNYQYDLYKFNQGTSNLYKIDDIHELEEVI